MSHPFTSLLEIGFNPIPIIAGDKKPAIKWQEYQNKRVTPQQCHTWDNSSDNVGIVTGAISGMWVLDVDGEEGQRTLAALIAKHGELSDTVKARSGNGTHYYFAYPCDGSVIRNLTGKTARGDALPHIDVRGVGGYIVAPPSLHPNGMHYEWIVSPFEHDILPAPDWLLALVTQSPEPTPPTMSLATHAKPSQAYLTAALDGEISNLCTTQEGQRNARLNTAAFRVGQLIPHGLDPALANSQLLTAALAIGLGRNEAIATIQSGFDAGQRNPRNLNREEAQTVWGEPLPFVDIPTPILAPELLPPVLCDFAREVARSTETPVCMVAGCVLGVLSCALAGKYQVNPKKGWLEHVNLYVYSELPPANSKSLVLKLCTEPLKRWEREQVKKIAPEIERLKSIQKTQIKRVEKMREQAAKEQDLEKAQKLDEDIALLDAEIAANPIPALPRLFANNVTPESLENLTYEQGGVFAVMSDEGGVMNALTGLYSNGNANVDIILKGIDGGDVRVKRKDRDIMMNPLLTFILCVQPVIRSKMQGNHSLQGNGALERFLYVLPKSTLGYRTLNQLPMDDGVRDRYHALITALLDIDLIRDDFGQLQPRTLTLSPEAQEAFYNFRMGLELRFREHGDLAPIQGWAGKLSGYALRMAGLCHIAQHKDNTAMIDITMMQSALNLAGLLINHAKAAFDTFGMDVTTTHAKMILHHIKSNGLLSITRGELTLELRHHVNAKQIDAAMEELQARNMVVAYEKQGKGTKPVIVYDFNPKNYT